MTIARNQGRPIIAVLMAAFVAALLYTGASRIQVTVAHEEGPDPTSGGGGYAPETCLDPSVCGKVEPLTPMHGAEAVHAGLVWKTHAATAKLLYWARHTEFKGRDVADPAVIQSLMNAGATQNGIGLEFNAALRPSFKKLIYGGFEMRQGLSQSVPTRILSQLDKERAQLFDFNRPDAFGAVHIFDSALLEEDEFAENAAAFQNAGFSAGLNYNLYCSGHASLADGRVVAVGGHDMNSNNGLFKVNVFDPNTERWAPRARPCTLSNWMSDPFGAQLFAANPNAPYFPGCNPLDINSTQPHDASDMKYARWYPTAIILPNNTVLVLGGTDQDATIGPDPKPIANQSDAAFKASKIHQVVPEIYDPATGRTVALEDARKIFPVYPQAEVVSTGPHKDDWKVCTIGGEDHVVDQHFDGPYKGKTWCLDVLGALRDRHRNTPAENHWELITEAPEGHDYCCSTPSLMTLGEDGEQLSHKVVLVAGKDANRDATATILMIDYADPNPTWVRQSDLVQTGLTHKTVVLPNGKVFIGAGRDASKTLYEERNSLRYQMFDPSDGSITVLAKTTVPRGLHGNAVLLPDGTVFVMGEDRINLVPRGDRIFPLGDTDRGVANGQLFLPPYLFNSDGSLATRPVITRAPDDIDYRGRFDVSVDVPNDQIGSVVIIRTDVNTHSLDTAGRYVRLAFSLKSNGRIKVSAPALPALALPGDYMLFVLNNAGVPSVAKHVRLRLDDEGEDGGDDDGGGHGGHGGH